MAQLRPGALNVLVQAAVLALVAGAFPAWAQIVARPLPEAVGAPRSLLPDRDAPAASATLAPPPALRQSQTAAEAGDSVIQVGSLGTTEGPAAGTFDDEQAGLGYGEWQGSDRATVETILQDLPSGTRSPAARFLLRKVLLTTAPPPLGSADKSFNAMRLTRLMDAGLVNDAADLAIVVQAPMNTEILRAQADALVYAGRDLDACGPITDHRFESAEPFWVELRAYCYAVADNMGALELTRNVIAEQGLSDPAFLTLLDGMRSDMPEAPNVIQLLDSVHLLMMARLNLPMTPRIATGQGLPANLMVAASPDTMPELRMVAAERAFRAGALSGALAREVFDLWMFMPSDLIGAPALARTEPMMDGLARLYAALKVTPVQVARADFIHTAFEIGEREGLLPQVAELFADEAAALTPVREWGNWADLMIRGLVLADRPGAAVRWLAILGPGGNTGIDAASRLRLVIALAQPGLVDLATTQTTLMALAERARIPEPEPDRVMPLTYRFGADGQPLTAVPVPLPPLPPQPPMPSPEVISYATLNLGLFDALSRPMPDQAHDGVEPLLAIESPGRRPPPVLMQRIDRASLAGRKGELALAVLAALGANGAGDLAPDVAVRLVRALQTGGINDVAHSVALEAMVRPPGL